MKKKMEQTKGKTWSFPNDFIAKKRGEKKTKQKEIKIKSF